MAESRGTSARLPSGRDVARLAGVSQATVSIALAHPNSKRVSASTRERIVQIADEIGYRPQRAGRQLRTGRTGLVLLAVPDVRSAFFARVLHGAQATATEADVSVVLGSGWNVKELQDSAAGGRFDGVVLCSPIDDHLDANLGGTSRVLLDADPTIAPGASWDLDVAAAMRQVVDHVRDLGHVRVGRLESAIASYTFRARKKAFDDAADGLDVVRESVDLTAGARGAVAAAERLLSAKDRPSVIVCDDDVIAAGVYSAAWRLGLSIPHDVCVTGIDDAPASAIMAPPLTTVTLPAEELGAAGVAMVLGQVDDLPELPRPELVVRESTIPRSEQRDA